jgi:O-antigen ligase
LCVLLLDACRGPGGSRAGNRRLLISGFAAGATVVAFIALGQFLSGTMLIEAEGVQRVRGFYGSPNNLALYLERALAISVALALFLPSRRTRLAWGALAAIQAAALVLTFSKGALFLALPALAATIWIGGAWILTMQGRPRRVLWLLAALAALCALGLMPFLSTERFNRLFDFESGTAFLRLQMWRSAWHMALDHPILGVGPDNFLYAFRSSYILPPAWQEPNLNHPHNLVLDLWTRLGLPGLALGLALLVGGLASLWRMATKAGRAPDTQAISVGLLGAATAATAHGFIDVSYALPDLMLIWVFLFGIVGDAREDG